MKQLKKNIYYVGAINPNLRVFDIIMSTEYGTTYNAYLVKGEKTALIETVHEKYSPLYFNNINEIVPVEKIDYLIMNHTEPDHSGSILKLIAKNPNLTIVGSASAIKNISNISNTTFNQLIVKTGDKLDLGNNVEFEFIIAPNLHWPDSMFSYIASEKTVFTCDFLGAHYCEPLITDDEITYPKAYNDAFAYYYAAIFGPFAKFVLSGLDKLAPLDFDMVCTSHGPVLKNNIHLATQLYRTWAEAKLKQTEKNVSIFYVSAYGYTKKLAKAFAENLIKKGIPAKTYDVIKHDYNELIEAFEHSSGVMIGSPTINRDALKPIWDLLSSVDAITNRGKPCMVFGSYGWSGEACKMLEQRVEGLGLKLVNESFRVIFNPNNSDLSQVQVIAENFANSL